MKKTSPLKKSSILLVIACLYITNSFQSVHAETLSRQNTTTVFGVIGDYGLAGQPEADVAALVKSWNPDFIVTLGDNNYKKGAAESLDQNIGQYYHDYIFPYKGTYGNGSPTKRFFPALGNHDWGSGTPNAYYNYFGFYNRVGYYDVIQGPVHLFILDSDPDEPDGTSSTSKQAKWLRNALAASTSAFNVVVLHHPPYSSGQHGPNAYTQWPYKAWGADVVLAGHDHIYERLLVDGLPYFVNGIGGAELYEYSSTIAAGSQMRFNQDYGAMRVETDGITMKFQMYTRAGILVDEYTIGQSTQTTPSITSISRVSASPSNINTLDFAVTFSEAVSGVDISDFTLTTSNINNAGINSVNGAGANYIISINSGSTDGTIRLDLIDNDSIISATGTPLGGAGIGNGNFQTGEMYTLDKTAPTILSILRANSNPTSANSVDFNITFSEPVTGVDGADFSLFSNTNNGAFISNISGAGNLYTVSVNTGNGNADQRLDLINNNSIADLVGNILNSNFTNGEIYNINKTVPNVTSILPASPNPTNAPSVDFAVTFSEAVSGVDASDFNLTTSNVSGTISNVSGAGNSYIVSVTTGNGKGTIRLDLIDNDSIINSSGTSLGDVGFGNGNFVNGGIYTVDKSAPSVTSIIRAGTNPTNVNNVDFIVTFSEAVTNLAISDFILTTNNITNATIVSINNANPFYIVTVNSGVGDGTIRLDLIDNDSIVNSAGIALGDTGTGNGNFQNGETYTIDKTAPIVTSIVRASANPTSSPSVDFIATFSEPVIGVDGSDFNPVNTNINSTSIINVTNVNPFYIITTSTGAGTGTLRMDLVNNNSITDLAGNILNGNFTAGETYAVTKNSVNFPAPSMIEPKKNIAINNTLPTFTWMLVYNAGAYELNIALDENFSNTILSQSLKKTTFTLTSPLADGIYYWRVRAYNADLQPGKFSSTQLFIVDTTPPPAPTLVSPPDHSTSTKKPWLQWRSVDTAVLYQIQVDNNADFSSPEATDSGKNPTIKLKSLSSGVYFWHVRAKDTAGNWGNWSSSFMLTVR